MARNPTNLFATFSETFYQDYLRTHLASIDQRIYGIGTILPTGVQNGQENDAASDAFDVVQEAILSQSLPPHMTLSKLVQYAVIGQLFSAAMGKKDAPLEAFQYFQNTRLYQLTHNGTPVGKVYDAPLEEELHGIAGFVAYMERCITEGLHCNLLCMDEAMRREFNVPNMSNRDFMEKIGRHRIKDALTIYMARMRLWIVLASLCKSFLNHYAKENTEQYAALKSDRKKITALLDTLKDTTVVKTLLAEKIGVGRGQFVNIHPTNVQESLYKPILQTFCSPNSARLQLFSPSTRTDGQAAMAKEMESDEFVGNLIKHYEKVSRCKGKGKESGRAPASKKMKLHEDAGENGAQGGKSPRGLRYLQAHLPKVHQDDGDDESEETSLTTNEKKRKSPDASPGMESDNERE